jgi:hypothetical protein
MSTKETGLITFAVGGSINAYNSLRWFAPFSFLGEDYARMEPTHFSQDCWCRSGL